MWFWKISSCGLEVHRTSTSNKMGSVMVPQCDLIANIVLSFIRKMSTSCKALDARSFGTFLLIQYLYWPMVKDGCFAVVLLLFFPLGWLGCVPNLSPFSQPLAPAVFAGCPRRATGGEGWHDVLWPCRRMSKKTWSWSQDNADFYTVNPCKSWVYLWSLLLKTHDYIVNLGKTMCVFVILDMVLFVILEQSERRHGIAMSVNWGELILFPSVLLADL